MAQGDLYRLLKRVSSALAKDMDSKGKGSERFRLRVEKYPHDVYLNRNDIRDEILIQLNDFKLTDEENKRRKAEGDRIIQQGARVAFGSGSGRTREESALAIRGLATTEGLTSAQIAAVEKEADLFLSSALSAAKTRRTGLKIDVLSHAGGQLVLRFTPTNSRTNVFKAVNEMIFQPAKDRLARNLTRVGFDITSERKSIFFNVGHINAVSTIKAAKAISAVDRGSRRILQRFPDPLAKEAADFIRTGIASKFTQFGDPELTKQFLIKAATVRPESQATNLTDSDYEAALLRDVRTSLRTTLNSLPNDWANQKSSDSIIDAISQDIFAHGERAFKSPQVKVTAPKLPKKRGPNQTSDSIVKLNKPKIQPKQVTSATYGGIKVANPFKGRSAASPISLQSLIPILNATLAEIIKKNMGQAGRLTNRTGRFAESAEIVAIDEGSFTIGYTYQKNPYAVFEGRGARDPRPLIEMSIREQARGYMNARFNIRRL